MVGNDDMDCSPFTGTTSGTSSSASTHPIDIPALQLHPSVEIGRGKPSTLFSITHTPPQLHKLRPRVEPTLPGRSNHVRHLRNDVSTVHPRLRPTYKETPDDIRGKSSVLHHPSPFV